MSHTITIHFYIHGRGRGHGSRSLPVIRALRADGHRVVVFAGEDALSLVVGEPGGATAIQSTPPGMRPYVAALITRRIRAAVAAIRKDSPAVIISDGDLPSTTAARFTKTPSVALGHGLVFAYCRRVAGAPAGPWWRERAKATLAAAGSARQVAVNFAPITAINPKRTFIARPTLRPSLASDLAQRPADTSDGPVVCYFRDNNGDQIARWLAELGGSPRLFTSRPGVKIPGVSVQSQDREAFAKALLGARAVVSSAGSQLISECVALGIPQFALFDATDDEQLLNVSMLRHFGLGDGAKFDACKPPDLAQFLATNQHPPVSPPPTTAMPAEDAVTAMRRAIAPYH